MRSLAQEVQHDIGESVTLAFVDQGYIRMEPAQEAMQLHGITRNEAKKALSGFCAVGVVLSRVLTGSSAFDD